MRAPRLQWLPEVGVGFLDPGKADIYGDDYFENYAKLADTDIGRRLNAARVAMLFRHWDDPAGVVDIGIGAGTFVASVPGIKGYDINPRGVEWLRERGLYHDPYAMPIDVAVLWDSIEHIPDPEPLLRNVRHRVLVSIPIFRDVGHVLRSKHYKPGEHCLYCTEQGFLWLMAHLGWKVEETNDYESVIGRQDIKSYAFRRAG